MEYQIKSEEIKQAKKLARCLHNALEANKIYTAMCLQRDLEQFMQIHDIAIEDIYDGSFFSQK